MDNMNEIMDGLSAEILKSIQDMSSCVHPEERKLRADTIKSLCESMGVFYSAISDAANQFGDMDEDLFADDASPFSNPDFDK